MKFSEQQNAQYKSFQNGESIYVDPDSVAIEVAGNDRAKFLHNFCTADINSLSSGDSTEAFVLDAKGKTLAFLLVICNDDRLILLAQQSQAESLLQHLNKYAFLQEATLTRLDEAKIVWRIGKLNAGIPTTLASGLQVQVVESTTAESEKDQSLLSNSVEKAVFEAFRVENRIPQGGVDVLDNLAQEFERDKTAISFNKGCYLGQETVARLDALGHTNKTLCLIQFKADESPDLETELSCGEKTCGRVTSVCWSPKHNSMLALAMIKKPNHKPGTTLQWGMISASVV